MMKALARLYSGSKPATKAICDFMLLPFFKGKEMDVARLEKNRRWMSAFFVGTLGVASYGVFASLRGNGSANLDPLFWIALVLAIGYIFFLCSLAKQLGENAIMWAVAVIVVVPIGFLYTYPRMLFYVSQAKRRLTSRPELGNAPSWMRK
jgi:uncharacterized membrane protein YobD (UPF0266 family)